MTPVVVGFPVAEPDRARLRTMAAARGLPLPSIYPDAVTVVCPGCAMAVTLGPRSAGLVATGAAVLRCVFCVIALMREGRTAATIASLGNPDSGWDQPS